MRQRRQRRLSAIQRQINRATGVYNARTSSARRAARGSRARSTLRGAVNATFSRNTNRAGAPVFSRRTGGRIGTMVKNGG